MATFNSCRRQKPLNCDDRGEVAVAIEGTMQVSGAVGSRQTLPSLARRDGI